MNPIINFYQDGIEEALYSIVPAGLHYYALLDHSFIPDKSLTSQLNGLLHWRSLYEEAGGDADISPLLCRMESKNSDQWRKQISTLLEICNGQPMLSLWHSSLDFESIYQHFVSYTDVKLLPEKLVYLLRYADTRTLPSLLSALNEKQHSQFMGPFEQLRYFDRAGNIIAVSNSPTDQINREALALDADQFSQMWNDSIPDQIISQLNMPNGHSWHKISPSEQYQQLLQLCRQAEQEGLVEPMEKEIFCKQALWEKVTISNR